MLASAIILFRETIEAALIVSIVLGATRGLQHRGTWVGIGMLAGLAGAAVVALFAQQISAAAQGSGQELFNAAVLFTACIMLGWHNVWMAQHGRQLAATSAGIGRQVSDGERHMSALAVVVGLAVLREGSEVVLFVTGILAGGAAAVPMLVGSLLGLAAGALFGLALYFGLMRIPVRHFFAVTAWLILLLAAGLAAQGTGYLVQADLVPALVDPLWDSSWLLSEQGLAGEVFGVLLGYTAQPSLAQLLAWLLALFVIGGLMWRQQLAERASVVSTATTAVLALMFGLLAPGSGRADHIIYSPIVDYGETEIELRGHYDIDSDDERDGESKYKLDFGRGVTDRWFTELVVEYERGADGDGEVEALEWENIFQLTEQGEYAADFGLVLSYEYALEDGHADAIEFGPLVQVEFGRKLWLSNLVFEREVGSDSESGIEWEFASRLQWRHSRALQPAIELFAEEDSWQLGPALLGEFDIGDGPESFGWEFAVLAGVSDDAPDAAIRFLVEAEFY